jgi:uncharacterized membrane protein
VNLFIIICIIFALGGFIFTIIKKFKGRTTKSKVILTIRSIILLLLILSLINFGLRDTSDTTTSIFLVDGSDSSSKSKEIKEDFVKNSISNMTNKDKVGIMNFGLDSAVEISPSKEPVFSEFETTVNSSYTNIANGLSAASVLIPEKDKKRIVLVTDGFENVGEAVEEVKKLKERNIIVDVYQVEINKNDDVQLSSLSAPERLYKNQKFDIDVKIDSLIETNGTIKLYEDNELIDEKDIEIKKGKNNYVFTGVAGEGGTKKYKAVIESDGDKINKNNELSTFTYIDDAARILVIENNNEASELIKILENDMYLDVKSPKNVPADVNSLQKYDGFVIANVDIDDFDENFLKSLEILIKHQGKGLLVTGGENSYALGGYKDTILEDVLPVNVDIKQKEEKPNLSLCVVIDKSGSMSQGNYGVSKMELANEAAIRSTDILRKDDIFGLIAFDDAAKWVIETGKIDDLQKVQDEIGSIKADGGTSIIRPLEEAYKSLKDQKTKYKHIILLTDGQAEKTGYDEVIENINEDNITLSTVAVGSGSDQTLLNRLADECNGRYYFTDEFSNIPKIFTKETLLASRTYLNNRTFSPTIGDYSNILKGITSVPTIDGYVGTTGKDIASVVLKTDIEDPLLATWQYGLGRTVAWTSDVKGIWSSSWLDWNNTSTYWKNIMSWMIQKDLLNKYSTETNIYGQEGELDLTIPLNDELLSAKTETTVVDEDGNMQDVSLHENKPGNYSGNFDINNPGVYIATTNFVDDDGNIIDKTAKAISVPYSPEYRITDDDPIIYLNKLVYESGGRVLSGSDDVFKGVLPESENVIDLTDILLLIAGLLLLMEIAIRKLNISVAFINKGYEFVKTRKLFKKTVTEKNLVKDLKNIKINQSEDNKSIEKNNLNEKNLDKDKNLKTNKDEEFSTSSSLLASKRKRDK